LLKGWGEVNTQMAKNAEVQVLSGRVLKLNSLWSKNNLKN